MEAHNTREEGWKIKVRDWWYSAHDFLAIKGAELNEARRVDLEHIFHQELQKARQEREIVNRLRQILAPQMALYKEYTEKEKTGEVDSSYVYDMAYEWFQNLSRGEFCSILEILTKDQSELDQPDALTK